LGLALVFGALSVGAAQAADLQDPVWAKAPDRADWAKAYPAAAGLPRGSEDALHRHFGGAAAGLHHPQ
jgi:hypothetical protein